MRWPPSTLHLVVVFSGRDEKQRSYNVTEKHPLRKDKARDEYGIPASFIDRLKITNVMEAMEQVLWIKMNYFRYTRY